MTQKKSPAMAASSDPLKEASKATHPSPTPNPHASTAAVAACPIGVGFARMLHCRCAARINSRRRMGPSSRASAQTPPAQRLLKHEQKQTPHARRRRTSNPVAAMPRMPIVPGSGTGVPLSEKNAAVDVDDALLSATLFTGLVVFVSVMSKP